MVQLTLVTVYYLEMLSPRDLRASARAPEGVEIRQAEVVSPELNRFLYTAVGGNWYWRERLPWDYQRWQQKLAPPNYATWIAYLRGTPAGYF
ncbi:MAG: hypothetical protein WDZ49_09060 [Litorilinea sp.]